MQGRNGNPDSQEVFKPVRGQFAELFDKLHAAGNTIIIVTHELDIARHAQRIVRLSDGAVVGDGPSGELL